VLRWDLNDDRCECTERYKRKVPKERYWHDKSDVVEVSRDKGHRGQRFVSRLGEIVG